MKLFGFFTILGFVLNLLGLVGSLSHFNIIALAISGIACAIMGYSSMLWYKWFKEDNKETTSKIVWFTKIMYLVSCVLTVVFGVLGILLGQVEAKYLVSVIVGTIINVILNIIVGWYYFQVTVRYHKQNYGDTEYAKIL